MGFDGLFIGRLDYQDKMVRLLNKTPEMIWQSSANLGKILKLIFFHPIHVLTNDTDNADLFTGVLYNNYGPPSGFCFDILCDDEPIIDDKHSPDYNMDRRVSYVYFKYNIIVRDLVGS